MPSHFRQVPSFLGHGKGPSLATRRACPIRVAPEGQPSAKCRHRDDVDSKSLSIYLSFNVSLSIQSVPEIDVQARFEVKLTSLRCRSILTGNRHEISRFEFIGASSTWYRVICMRLNFKMCRQYHRDCVRPRWTENVHGPAQFGSNFLKKTN